MQSDPRGPLPERPTTPPPPPPVSGGARPSALCDDPECTPPPVRWHRIQIVTVQPDGQHRTYSAEGDDAWAASALRSYADQINPARPTTPAMRPAGARAPEPGERPASMVARPASTVSVPPRTPGRERGLSTE